jgi:glucose-6-phosphate isomerase
MLENLSKTHGPITINLDRQLITALELHEQANTQSKTQIEGMVKRLFSGEEVNGSEHRAAGHWALRAAAHPDCYPVTDEVQFEIAQARHVQQNMEIFVDQLHGDEFLTPDQVPYENIVHIGIGGSDLGPRLLHDVFSKLNLLKKIKPLGIHFLSNVDFHEVQHTLLKLNAKTTLVVIASKSFSTKETLLNAQHLFDWLDQAGPQYREQALIGVTCKPDKARALGVATNRIFEFSETVGGRYSLWGPVSLSIRLVYGNAIFNEFLKGAAHLDQHVIESAATESIPALMALCDHYNLQQGAYSLMLSPYDSRLSLLVPYLQQLWMESLGKGVDTQGQPIRTPCCPILWGDVGTNGQHAFFQMLHQSRLKSSVELIGIINPDHQEKKSHQVLLSHLLAQAQAFSVGKLNTAEESCNPNLNYKTCPGNRPVQVLMLKSLSPYSLGSLLAMWEHRTIMLAALQNINPFDQWGVELGKVIAERIEPTLADPHASSGCPQTDHLLSLIREKTH